MLKSRPNISGWWGGQRAGDSVEHIPTHAYALPPRHTAPDGRHL